MHKRRVGVFGWGIVAPRSPNVDAFARNLEFTDTWLTSFSGFGPNNFLVGTPQFSFADYRGWVAERFPPTRFRQLEDKMDLPALYAVGSFVQALGQNPGLEQELTRLGSRTHIYVGTGLGSLATIGDNALALDRVQRRWDRYWAERNPELRAWLAEHDAAAPAAPASAGQPSGPADMPVDPRTFADSFEQMDDLARAQGAWWHYWAGRCADLHLYLAELAAIDGHSVQGDVERGKMSVLKEKQRRQAQLQKQWGAPTPPWQAVSANLVWNIQNTPASQISMLGHITGMTFAPVAACSTFGVSLKLAMDAIESGRATAVVVGATDPPPIALSVGAFYSARVIASDTQVSKPLTGLRGTHVAGGAVVWIVADLDHMRERGFKPLGMEPLAVGVSADADHIITPSAEGPSTAIDEALREAGVAAADIGSWDLHATATPGDDLEVATLRSRLPGSVLVTARKGTFGHGMSAGSGWELTAQYMGYERGRLYPTGLQEHELNREIAARHGLFVFDHACDVPQGDAGKLSMGIGGINACVISRPW